MRKKIILFALLLNTYAFIDSFAQQMPLVYDVENTCASYPKPVMPSVSELPTIVALPDPFEWADGRGRILNFSDWQYRRAEIGAQIQNYEIGEKPARPDSITASYSAGVLTVNVTVNGKTLTLTSQVALPTGTGLFPAVIGLNSPSGSIPSTIFSSRNIARITFSLNQVSSYGNPQVTNPYYQLYPALNPANTGQYSAWAWGVSRIIDGLELVQNNLPIDLKHLAVTGCSYAGKLALFAGAFDERIALTISQESGGGGYTTWRYSEELNKIESVETLSKTDYNWFKDAMLGFSASVTKLPEDHHELMAMVAPRALFVTGNPGWVWLADQSGHVGSNAAKEVWNALGVPDRFGYSLIGGHNHCEVPSDQIPQIEAFVDKFLLGKDTVITNVASTPYTTDLSPWITWTTPTLSNDTSIIKWTSLSYPSDLQTGMDTNITFRWNKVQNAEKYFIQVSLNPGFTNPDKIDTTTMDTVITLSGLSKAKRYYWHVKVQSSAGVDLWSNTWSLITTTSLPAAPQLISATPKYPTRADVFTLTWNKVQDADQYLVNLSKVQTFASDLRTGYPTDTVITFTALTKGQQYYWRIQASNFVGSGPWSDVANFTTIVVSVNEEEGIPTKYLISQNSPNPFNPTTSIRYDLPKNNHVRLVVYDMLGRHIQTLVDREQSAGRYKVEFDASNLTSGIYFYKIQSGDFIHTKKMILTK